MFRKTQINPFPLSLSYGLSFQFRQRSKYVKNKPSLWCGGINLFLKADKVYLLLCEFVHNVKEV